MARVLGAEGIGGFSVSSLLLWSNWQEIPVTLKTLPRGLVCHGRCVKTPDCNNSLNSYNPRMRRAIGIVLILLGAIGLEICGIVLLHWPLPIPGFILRGLGGFGLFVDPVKAPISAVVLMIIGSLVLLKPKLPRFK